MIIHYGYEDLKLNSPVVTLGIFDGVHKGHRTLLDKLVLEAKAAGGDSVVVTFSPHPRLVLQKDHLNLSFLSTLEEKINLLEAAGVDHLIIIEFSREFSNIEACDFVRDILVEKIGTQFLIIGHDHHFGKRGDGDFNTIQKCSEALSFRVEQVEGFSTADGNVSSSSIRQALLEGKIEMANSLLGYNYPLTGSVVTGKQIGRSLGFPTANISPDDKYKLVPGNGVYAVEVKAGETHYLGMLSIGTNPTVNSDILLRSIEVHILDFEGDIYDQRITVLFRKKLRDEKKFDNISQLIDQMRIDQVNTIKYLG